MGLKMTIAIGLLLGVIQGLTEFLPVSSTAHLAIAENILTWSDKPLSAEAKEKQDQQWLAVDVMLHLGTLLAVVVYLRREVWQLIRGFFILLASISPAKRPAPGTPGHEDRRLLLYVIAASVPTAVIALVIKKTVEKSLGDMFALGVFLMITGVILFITRSFGKEGRPFAGMRLKDSLLVGVVQGLAALPGISRSGSTISTGLFLKLDGRLAARFSFLISVPVIFGAALFEGKELQSGVLAEIWPAVLAGIAAAFVFGCVAIWLVFRILERRKLSWFAPYCWLAGAACVIAAVVKVTH